MGWDSPDLLSQPNPQPGPDTIAVTGSCHPITGSLFLWWRQVGGCEVSWTQYCLSTVTLALLCVLSKWIGVTTGLNSDQSQSIIPGCKGQRPGPGGRSSACVPTSTSMR